MKINIKRTVGIFFVFVGLLILLKSLNLFEGTLGNIIWVIVMGGTSIYFFAQFAKSRLQLWWLILGLVFFSIAASNLIDLFGIPSWVGDAIFFAGIGLGFISIYIIDKLNWWAMLPGALIVSLGIIRILEKTFPEVETSGILFLGLGIAFLLLYSIPTKYGRLSWAFIPGVALLGIGFLFNFSGSGDIFSYIGPGLLVLSGMFVLFISLRK